MLRGPQTPGELKQRSARLHNFADLAAIHSSLERLLERDLIARQERRPGQKEERYEQLLGGVGSGEAAAAAPAEAGGATPGEPAARPAEGEDDDRLARLEREVARLRSDLDQLRQSLGEG